MGNGKATLAEGGLIRFRRRFMAASCWPDVFDNLGERGLVLRMSEIVPLSLSDLLN